MRYKLQDYYRKPITLIGSFTRYGINRSHKQITALLNNLVFENGYEACDHIWLLSIPNLSNSPKQGDKIKIIGMVGKYRRGNGSKDFCISCLYMKVLKDP